MISFCPAPFKRNSSVNGSVCCAEIVKKKTTNNPHKVIVLKDICDAENHTSKYTFFLFSTAQLFYEHKMLLIFTPDCHRQRLGFFLSVLGPIDNMEYLLPKLGFSWADQVQCGA